MSRLTIGTTSRDGGMSEYEVGSIYLVKNPWIRPQSAVSFEIEDVSDIMAIQKKIPDWRTLSGLRVRIIHIPIKDGKVFEVETLDSEVSFLCRKDLLFPIPALEALAREAK